MVETHLCERNYNFGHLISCNWLAKHNIKDIIRMPNMTLSQMMEYVLTKYYVKVSKGQCHRERARAREMIEGKLEEHYAKLCDYANEILRSNPGSTCKVGVSVNPDRMNYFQRFHLLVDDLGVEGGRGLVVISNQHKGLLESVKVILPHVEHRQCTRHIYANFRKKHIGLELKNLLWAAATRNFFTQGYACEAVENGIYESFNSMIINIRKKPLLTMLKEIRIYVMARFYYLADKASTCTTESCPAIIDKMKDFGKEMRNWKVIVTRGSVFETRYWYAAYKVISGIPCVHGQAAINYTHTNPTDFLSIWFQKYKFVTAYTTNISPVNGSNMWAPADYIKSLPPLTRRMPSRPKTKRRRHVSKVNDSKFPTVRARVCRTVRCSKYLQFGHNLKSCKNEQLMRDYVPPKKNRKAKEGWK
uniref:MULE transposase domain-containing protein n=1 Tax=Lactuca sativa TaxID=4236 RepID=A0A9R1UK08_LACSA|nr:hypothetical protein LSAT_V11C900477080 [Lactuca sativa]